MPEETTPLITTGQQDEIILCPKCYPKVLSPLLAHDLFCGYVECPIHGVMKFPYSIVFINEPKEQLWQKKPPQHLNQKKN